VSQARRVYPVLGSFRTGRIRMVVDVAVRVRGGIGLDRRDPGSVMRALPVSAQAGREGGSPPDEEEGQKEGDGSPPAPGADH